MNNKIKSPRAKSVFLRKNSLNPLVFLGSIIYPVYMLPWILKSMQRNEYFGYILYSSLMGCLAYLMIPYEKWDLVSHYMNFNIIGKLEFNEIYEYCVSTGYLKRFFLYKYMWIVHNLGLRKEFIPFSFIFSMLMLYFMSLKNVVSVLKNSRESLYYENKIMVIALFLLIANFRLMDETSGLRSGLGQALFIYSVVNYYLYKNLAMTAILVLFSIVVHISLIPLAVIFFFAHFIRLNEVTRRFLLYAGLIILLSGLSGAVFYKIIDLIAPFLQSHGMYFYSYMNPEGLWGGAFYADKDFKTVLLEKIIKPLPFYVAGGYMLYVRKLYWSPIQNYIHLLFLFVAIVSVSRTMLDRYSYIFFFIFIYVLIFELHSRSYKRIKKVFLVYFVSALLLMNLVTIIGSRNIPIRSWGGMLYLPLPIVLMNEVTTEEYIHRESL